MQTAPMLHHHLSSGVTEILRTAVGIEGLTWYSAELNHLPDRPELFAKTGGHLRIPVLQVGTEPDCNTRLILQELERHS